MQKFAQANDLQKSMVNLLVGLKGDKEELAKLKNVYQIFDADRDGYLKFKEIQQANKKLNALTISDN